MISQRTWLTVLTAAVFVALTALSAGPASAGQLEKLNARMEALQERMTEAKSQTARDVALRRYTAVQKKISRLQAKAERAKAKRAVSTERAPTWGNVGPMYYSLNGGDRSFPAFDAASFLPSSIVVSDIHSLEDALHAYLKLITKMAYYHAIYPNDRSHLIGLSPKNYRFQTQISISGFADVRDKLQELQPKFSRYGSGITGGVGYEPSDILTS